MNNIGINLPKDPLSGVTIEELGQKFRNSLLSCKEITSIYYERIRILNPHLHAYIFVDEEKGLDWAEGIDKLFVCNILGLFNIVLNKKNFPDLYVLKGDVNIFSISF